MPENHASEMQELADRASEETVVLEKAIDIFLEHFEGNDRSLPQS